MALALWVVWIAPSPALAAKRVALVLGNSAYQHTTSLPNPVNDAADIAQTLEKLGFSVQQRSNLDRNGMQAALAQFARSAVDADVALFFYAGHGMQYQGRNYVVPVDASLQDDLDVRFQLVPLDDVRSAMERVPGVKLILLDACRNNPLVEQLARSLKGTTRAADVARGLARVPLATGSVIAFSTQADQVAQDGQGRNSPFSKALVTHLSDQGVEIGTLFRRVAAQVYQDTKGQQVPELSVSLLQEVYLNPEPQDVVDWRNIRLSSNPGELAAYIKRWPASPYSDEARAQLALIERAANEQTLSIKLKEELERRKRESDEKAARELDLKRQLDSLEQERRRVSDELAVRNQALAQAQADRVAREAQFEAQVARREAELRTDVERTFREASKAEVDAIVQRKLQEARADAVRAAEDAVRASQASRDKAALDSDRKAEALAAQVAALQAELDKAKAASLQLAAKDPGLAGAEALRAPAPPQAIMKELARVGCYAGSPTADWSSREVQAALKSYAEFDHSALPDRPTQSFLDGLLRKTGRICLSPCKAGETRDKDGTCLVAQFRPSRPAPAPHVAPVQHVAPAHKPRPEAPPAASGSSKCFKFNGQTYCE